MGVDDIAAMPIKDRAADDSHLFMWITGPMFVEGKHIPIMKAWGFRPSSVAFTWIKLKKRAPTLFFDRDSFHVGLGLTTRKNAEFVVLGRRGSCRRLAKDVRELVLEPVREHSRKPDEVAARIERYCAGPYLELFARAERPGWTCWGNEVGKFGAAA
jgi:N6-adenosine-specific RNA methylase IME4